jgi:putative colanic acid biosynthesis acetyltransferase WcaF
MDKRPDRGDRPFQDLTRFRVPPGFRGRGALMVQIWWCVEATLFAWSPQFLFGWRRFLLRLFGAQIGIGVKVRPSASVTYPWKLRVGDHSWIGDEVVLYTLDEIEIGAHSVVSQRSYLCAGSHDPESADFAMIGRPIRIGAQCWLATDVFVSPGVSIGDGAVVGARSTVLGDLPPAMICYGNPARPIRQRGDAPETALDTR